MDSTKFPCRWFLIRISDSDESIVGIELDGCQARFKTHHDERLGVTFGTITLSLSGRQTSLVEQWWKAPE
jgi:hypothetical protein